VQVIAFGDIPISRDSTDVRIEVMPIPLLLVPYTVLPSTLKAKPLNKRG